MSVNILEFSRSEIKDDGWVTVTIKSKEFFPSTIIRFNFNCDGNVKIYFHSFNRIGAMRACEILEQLNKKIDSVYQTYYEINDGEKNYDLKFIAIASYAPFEYFKNLFISKDYFEYSNDKIYNLFKKFGKI